MKKTKYLVAATVLTIGLLNAAELHVSPAGNDQNNGLKEKPFQTISAAANVAQPGDVVTVHEGIYRERVNPPRGGTSDTNRITYQAAPGKKVTITGSEPMKGWEKVSGDTWKVIIPNKFFGDFNPYAERIRGDWFNPKGRQHHTGSVYLNGEWLTEAASHLNEVLAPVGKTPLWFAKVDNAEDTTTLWAQFPGVNPNDSDVEINVRKTVFTPEKPGINYITVRGFTLRNAATEPAKAAPQQRASRGASHGLSMYDPRETPQQTGGNVHCNGAKPYSKETKPLMMTDKNPAVKLIQQDEKFVLQSDFGTDLKLAGSVLITTDLLGKAKISNAAYENADSSPLKIDTDYLGAKRNEKSPFPGPLEITKHGQQNLQVWPIP